MERETERRAKEAVDWLAALWELTDPEPSRSANPDLVTLLQVMPGLDAHPALQCVARRRRETSRDRLVKVVVGAAYEGAPGDELVDALQALLESARDLVGAGPHRLLQEARALASARAADIAGELDPASDLSEVTGERIPLRVVLAPSVFLPPPQAGRHGVLVRRGDERVAHLHFGFPLNQDPQRFSIGRPWLLGGAWHYAIHLYLERHWPEVARRLAERPELAEAVSAGMGPRGGAQERPWTDFLQAHLNVALKCLLARRLGIPDGVHRAFARARGLVLFPWFSEWLLDSGAEGAALAAHIGRLPEALVTSRPRWEGLVQTGGGPPPTINLALISPGARGACLVVPDEWPESAVAAAAAGWRLLSLRPVRYRDWALAPASPAAPVVAVGEPELNPLVRRVLESRGLSLDSLAAADPAVMALSLPTFEEAAWCVAVAVRRPETAAGLRVEMALKRTSSYVVFDRGVEVASGRVAIDALAPASPSS
jgi:hypothetical protein